MPTLERDELTRFLGEHLTAPPQRSRRLSIPHIDPNQPVRDAHAYLAQKDFDVALVKSDRLIILTHDAAEWAATTTPTRPTGEVAQLQSRYRVIEQTCHCAK
jgi:hypothetical protein